MHRKILAHLDILLADNLDVLRNSGIIFANKEPRQVHSFLSSRLLVVFIPVTVEEVGPIIIILHAQITMRETTAIVFIALVVP